MGYRHYAALLLLFPPGSVWDSRAAPLRHLFRTLLVPTKEMPGFEPGSGSEPFVAMQRVVSRFLHGHFPATATGSPPSKPFIPIY